MMNKLNLSNLRNRKITRRIIIFLLLFAFFYALKWLPTVPGLPLPSYIFGILDAFVLISFTLLVITILIRVTGGSLYRLLEEEVELEQRIFISKLYSFIFYFIGASIILWKLGVSLEQLTLVFGLLTTAVAFIMRDMFLSYFAWFIILSKKPFRIGNNIKVGDDEGQVTRIGTFFFTIKRYGNGAFAKIPNKVIFDKTIQNNGNNARLVTVQYPISIIPHDVDKKIAQLTKKLEQHQAKVTIRAQKDLLIVIEALVKIGIGGETEIVKEVSRLFKAKK